MGDMPAWVALLMGAWLMWCWLMIGAGLLSLFRPDLTKETWAALTNCIVWPAGVVAQLVVWPIYKRRKERARQARLTAKVQSGEYAVEHARNLGWKG